MSHLLSTFQAKHSRKSRNITVSMRKRKQRLEKQEQLSADIRGVIFHPGKKKNPAQQNVGATHTSIRGIIDQERV